MGGPIEWFQWCSLLLIDIDMDWLQKTAWGPDDPGWIHFSLTKAPWVPFKVHPNIREAMAQLDTARSTEELKEWLHRAESSVNFWIIDQILGKEGRAERFRALGR